MKISARNQIADRVTAHQSGAVNGSVEVDIGSFVAITANITMDAIADLALGEGDQVTVLMKASDVLI